MRDLVPTRKPGDFSPEVHQSLAALQKVARLAKSKDDPGLRFATADEIALSELQHKPRECTAHSARTGLACRGAAIKGLAVCVKHGGLTGRAKRAARRRLAELTPTLIESQAWLASQRDHLPTAANAAKDLLDRAGVGALVQAKVRASKQQQATGAQVVVNIGFLSQ